MAKRAHAYPQAEPAAGGLVNVAVLRISAQSRVAEALTLARRREAGVLATTDGQWVLREDLSRAAGLGLPALVVTALARPLPVVDVGAPEVSVRRLLASGRPAVVVCDGREVVGAVMPAPRQAMARVPLGRWFPDRLPESARTALDTIVRLAGHIGARAFLVGGTVRDAWLGRSPAGDLDIVVEGDAPELARAFAAAREVPSAAAVEHARFLTASVTLPGLGRVDFATARSERYECPGALPRVVPSTITQDLARRDFTVNALAVELAADGWDLLDPFGGRRDLAARRLRVLHPLSFVEDPTRIFRAARYATRLGLALDAWTMRARARALRLGPYPALSGQRVAAELEAIVGEPRPGLALRHLGRAGAFRLLDARYRFTRRTAERVDALSSTLSWSRQHELPTAPLELTALALVADQRRDVAAAALGRLGFSGEPLTRLRRALNSLDDIVPRLGPGGRASERARPLWDRSGVELAWLWLAGEAQTRTAVDWFLVHARGARRALNGDAVVALGVPRGAEVAQVLAELRDARLDGVVSDRDGERRYVEDWVSRHHGVTTGRGSGAGAAPPPDGHKEE
jgi:tRNA nucleotidyltransferase (CCA-adding enzyme)